MYEEGVVSADVADDHKVELLKAELLLGKMGKLISVLSIFYFPCSIIFLTFPTFPKEKIIYNI